ncbi:hypothetical protein ACLBW8_08240 [Pseudomonas sp. M5A4_2d]
MRYLKVVAQDSFGSGKPDTVLLRFCEAVADHREVIVNSAFAFDFIEDGHIDFRLGDVNHDGVENERDRELLNAFGSTYLKLNWFNCGADTTRFMHVYSEDFYKDGTPDTVRLQLYEETGITTKKTLVMWNAAYDFDNDGALEWNIHFDINNDGVINDVDKALVQKLADIYLKFNWHRPDGMPRFMAGPKFTVE